LSMIFFGKPVSTFPDHALARGRFCRDRPDIRSRTSELEKRYRLFLLMHDEAATIR
jgi:hypothetical protein